MQPPVAFLRAETFWWLTLLVPVDSAVLIFPLLCDFCCLLLLPRGSIFVSLPFVRLLEELTAMLIALDSKTLLESSSDFYIS